MKKGISLLLIVAITTMLLLCGCSNAKEISELETEIAELDEKIIEAEQEMAEWQRIYDEAYAIYSAPHSNTPEIQKELERTEGIMDKARIEINELKREIALHEMVKSVRERELAGLKSGD